MLMIIYNAEINRRTNTILVVESKYDKPKGTRIGWYVPCGLKLESSSGIRARTTKGGLRTTFICPIFLFDWNALVGVSTNNASLLSPSFWIKASTFFLIRINHVDPANSFRFYISELMGQWKRSMRNLKKLDFSWNPQGWSLTML